MDMLTLNAFEEASEKVKEVTQETKLVYSPYFSDRTGNCVGCVPVGWAAVQANHSHGQRCWLCARRGGRLRWRRHGCCCWLRNGH